MQLDAAANALDHRTAYANRLLPTAAVAIAPDREVFHRSVAKVRVLDISRPSHEAAELLHFTDQKAAVGWTKARMVAGRMGVQVARDYGIGDTSHNPVLGIEL